jgi:DNA-binding SARP family transcriptional activator
MLFVRLPFSLEPPSVPQYSILLADRESVGLSSLVTTDVALFKHHSEAAEKARTIGNPRCEECHLLDALTVYRDTLLPGYQKEWVVSLRHQFAEQSLLSLQRLDVIRQESKGTQ